MPTHASSESGAMVDCALLSVKNGTGDSAAEVSEDAVAGTEESIIVKIETVVEPSIVVSTNDVDSDVDLYIVVEAVGTALGSVG